MQKHPTFYTYIVCYRYNAKVQSKLIQLREKMVENRETKVNMLPHRIQSIEHCAKQEMRKRIEDNRTYKHSNPV